MQVARVPFSPFADDFWNQPPRKTIGEQNEDTIYLEVGRALTQWEVVEGFLGRSFSIFVESESEAPGRAYGAIASGRSRASMLAQSSEAFFRKLGGDPNDIKSNTLLINSYNLAAARRNEIAHGMVVRFIDGDINKDHGCLLVSPDYNSLKTHPKYYWENNIRQHTSKYAFNADDIHELSDKFSQLSNKVIGHNLYLSQKYVVPRKMARSQP